MMEQEIFLKTLNQILEMSDISFAKNVDQQNHLHIIVEGMYFYAKQATYRLCKKKFIWHFLKRKHVL